jgi:hypothetical protein
MGDRKLHGAVFLLGRKKTHNNMTPPPRRRPLLALLLLLLRLAASRQLAQSHNNIGVKIAFAKKARAAKSLGPQGLRRRSPRACSHPLYTHT